MNTNELGLAESTGDSRSNDVSEVRDFPGKHCMRWCQTTSETMYFLLLYEVFESTWSTKVSFIESCMHVVCFFRLRRCFFGFYRPDYVKISNSIFLSKIVVGGCRAWP